MTAADGYDEFGLLAENLAEAGLPPDTPRAAARRSYQAAPGLQLSAISWPGVIGWPGAIDAPSATDRPGGPPELVLLHGGGQNAHTWDTVALALGRPALAIDLPGHGHSGRRPDRDYGPWRNAEAVAAVLDQVRPAATGVTAGLVVVGMSLGGVTAIRLAASRPDLVRALIVVDVTPQAQQALRTMSVADQGAVALVSGPPVFDSFDAIAAAAVAASPGRPRSAVERGVRHNAVQRPDGRWTWRYDLFGDRPAANLDFSGLWTDVSAITAPVMLVRGGDSAFVTDADAAEFSRRQPGLRVEVVPHSGHSVQGDQPLALTRLIEDFAFGQA